MPLLKVYPRVCGGTRLQWQAQACARGLSPRMRGNPIWLSAQAAHDRSIPAYAGEPNPRMRSSYATKVYPRVCGGTPPFSSVQPGMAGLSPRMRGNPSRAHCAASSIGSIPAYAGEPVAESQQLRRTGVYPRVCGGTTGSRTVEMADTGLSPRMRGNQPSADNLVFRQRSIPAYAGEPRSVNSGSSAGGVYPRVCGGTTQSPAQKQSPTGLSPRMRGNPPRMRGNHSLRLLLRAVLPSIPAYAGEPGNGLPLRTGTAVYPRVCGGTTCTTRASVWS